MRADQPLLPPSLRIVLVGTSHPGNVGASARAMRTMGLATLALVAPECDPRGDEARARAAGAEALLEAASVLPDLDAALADCRLVLGCTARRRTVRLPEWTPREAAPHLLSAAAQGPVALLFGRERSGLANEELQRCHAAVHIPVDPQFGSLNLAAAVQVLAYELRLAALAGTDAAATGPALVRGATEGRGPPATQNELERYFEHLDQALIDIEFHKGRAGTMVMRRLRRLFLRAGLDAREVRILRGILNDAQRMARKARSGP